MSTLKLEIDIFSLPTTKIKEKLSLHKSLLIALITIVLFSAILPFVVIVIHSIVYINEITNGANPFLASLITQNFWQGLTYFSPEVYLDPYIIFSNAFWVIILTALIRALPHLAFWKIGIIYYSSSTLFMTTKNLPVFYANSIQDISDSSYFDIISIFIDGLGHNFWNTVGESFLNQFYLLPHVDWFRMAEAMYLVLDPIPWSLAYFTIDLSLFTSLLVWIASKLSK